MDLRRFSTAENRTVELLRDQGKILRTNHRESKDFHSENNVKDWRINVEFNDIFFSYTY